MEIVPYNESSISNDSLKKLQQGALIIREKDNEINYINQSVSQLRLQINILKKERKTAENTLLPIMINEDIDCLNTNNGSINFVEEIKKNTLNKKNLEKLLNKIFNEDNNLYNLSELKGNNNIETSELRTKYLIEFLINNSDKKKTITLNGTGLKPVNRTRASSSLIPISASPKRSLVRNLHRRYARGSSISVIR